MRTARLLTVLVVLAAFAPASSAAKDMSGKFGIGFDQSLGGVSGINFKYFMGDFSLWVTPGVDLFAPKDGDTAVALNIALAGIYNFARSEQANFGAGLRVDFGYRNKAAGDTWQVNLEIPLVAEFFFTDHFALHLSTAIVLQIIPDTGPALSAPTAASLTKNGSSSTVTTVVTSADGKTQTITTTTTGRQGIGFSFGSGSLVGSAGFTYYF